MANVVNLKAFSRMDGTPIPTIEIAQNKAYTALFGVSTQDSFNFIQATRPFWPASPCFRVSRLGVEASPSRSTEKLSGRSG